MIGTRGRPRSEEARRAILETALRLCAQVGYPQLTIKAIADEARVGRQTVYRWWSHKADILIDAMLDLRERKLEQLYQATGDTLGDVETVLKVTFEVNREFTGPALVGVMADAQHDPDLSNRLQSVIIGPRRDALRDILRRGVDAGELAENIPLPLAVDFAFGTMWYRMLSHHAPVDDELARQITDALARLLAASP